MCGLVGLWTKTHNKDSLYAARYLTMLSSSRGHHSTGITVVDKKGDYNYLKSTMHPFDAIRDEEYLEELAGTDLRFYMAHTRAATHGEINPENAHPFETERYVGMHNGTIHHGIPPKYSVTGGTDSEGLYNLLTEEGIGALEKVKWGAYALQMYDLEDTSVKLIRNKERPLWIAKSKDLIMWASEKRTLEWVANGASFEYEELPAYTLMTITLEGVISTVDMSEEIGPKVYHYQDNNKYAWWNNSGWNKKEEKKEEKETDWVRVGEFREVSRWRYNDIISKGCSFCGSMDVHDPLMSLTNSFLCEVCWQDPETVKTVKTLCDEFPHIDRDIQWKNGGKNEPIAWC